MTDSNSSEYFLELNNERAVLLVPVSLYIGLTMVFGTFGNSLICYVYGLRLKITTTNCFILWLALFDVVCCTVTLPLEIVEMRYPFYYIETCRFQRFHMTGTAIASGLILLAIAVERYSRVCNPLKANIETRSAVILSISSGVLALVLSIPVVFIYGRATYPLQGTNVTVSECSTRDEMQRTVIPSVYYAFLFFLFFGILIPLCILYGLVWKELRQRKKAFSVTIMCLSVSRNSFASIPPEFPMERRKSSPSMCCNQVPNGGSEAARKSTIEKRNRRQFYNLRQTTFKLFVITAFFTISFIPYHAVMIYRTVVQNMDGLGPTGEVVYNLLLRSYQLYALNPTIYGLCDQKFWQELRSMTRGCLWTK